MERPNKKCNCNCIFTVELSEETEENQDEFTRSHAHRRSQEIAMSGEQLKYLREIARHKRPKKRARASHNEQMEKLDNLILSL